MTAPAEDIPALVEQEIIAAQAANIPPADQARYVADRIRHRIGGGYEYTRKRPLSPAKRAEAIRGEWRGNNLDELAKKWNLSTRQIRRIVS